MDGLKPLVIIGAGGHGREMLDLVNAVNKLAMTYNMLGYLVDPAYMPAGSSVRQYKVLGGIDWLANHPTTHVICGIGDSRLRAQVVARINQHDAIFPSLIHPSALLTKDVAISDEGVMITAGAVLTSNIVIGNHVHINIGATISHDCVLEPFVTISPGVNIAGNVTVGAESFLGIGCSIIEKVNIGRRVVVGAGSVVIRDVPDNTTVVGVPAKVIKTA